MYVAAHICYNAPSKNLIHRLDFEQLADFSCLFVLSVCRICDQKSMPAVNKLLLSRIGGKGKAITPPSDIFDQGKINFFIACALCGTMESFGRDKKDT